VKLDNTNGQTFTDFNFVQNKVFLVRNRKPTVSGSKDCERIRLTNHINVQKLRETKFPPLTEYYSLL
jgi:hypothetical protein